MNRRRRKDKKAAMFLVVILFLFGFLFFYLRIYRVEQAFTEMTCEYGEKVSTEIEDYLLGTDWSVHLGELDLSQVNEKEPGAYEAMVLHGGKRFVYAIAIQDTIAPQILWKEGQIYLALGAAYAVEDVIEGVSDVDTQARAFFLEGEDLRSDICFDQVGTYALEIVARDRSGNETIGEMEVIVDTPPDLKGIHDFYVVPGSKPDYGEAVTAWDDMDGDLTASIQVDDSGVSLDEAGSYTLRYLAEDSCGLETVEEALVMVAAPEQIQEMIGHREIDRHTDCILGAPNLYDGGASEQEDMEEALAYMRPALVQLYHSIGRGGYSSGSGYIMEITQDRLYICSNKHVVEKYEDWDVYFFNGERIRGKRIGFSETYDVGVVEVALEDVPAELLDQLMTVHIDRTYWEGLDEQKIDLALERIDRSGGLVHTTTGNLIKIKQKFDWLQKRSHTEVTIELVHGDSGSAVLDGYGNLICMAYAYSTDPVRYWCIPLDAVLACYEEITGRTPYVY